MLCPFPRTPCPFQTTLYPFQTTLYPFQTTSYPFPTMLYPFQTTLCPFQTTPCPFSRTLSVFVVPPEADSATLPPFFEHPDALSTVPKRLREARRALGPTACAFVGRLHTNKTVVREIGSSPLPRGGLWYVP
jgi:hypothetical protein